MSRKLNDYRIKEYKSSLLVTVMQALMTFLALFAFFMVYLPVAEKLIIPFESQQSDIVPLILRFEMKRETMFGVVLNPTQDLKTTVSIMFAIYSAYLFSNISINSFIPSVGKSIYAKLSKLIEILVAIVCLFVMSIYFINISRGGNIFSDKIDMSYSNLHVIVVVINLIISIVAYFTTKKVSIYD